MNSLAAWTPGGIYGNGRRIYYGICHSLLWILKYFPWEFVTLKSLCNKKKQAKTPIFMENWRKSRTFYFGNYGLLRNMWCFPHPVGICLSCNASEALWSGSASSSESNTGALASPAGRMQSGSNRHKPTGGLWRQPPPQKNFHWRLLAPLVPGCDTRPPPPHWGPSARCRPRRAPFPFGPLPKCQRQTSQGLQGKGKPKSMAQRQVSST